MIKNKIIESVIEGVNVRKRSDSPKLTIVMIDSDDRQATSRMIRQRVQQLVGDHFHGRVSGSSFLGGIEFETDERKVRLVFKEYSSSKMGLNTKLYEAAQCVYLAAAQAKRSSVDSSWVMQNVGKFSGNIDIQQSPDQIFDGLDDGWRKSSEIIANHLQPKLRHNQFVFHHDSRLVRTIYSHYKRLNTGRTFTQSDNWNPADIWAIRKGISVTADKMQSFEEINVYLRDSIDEGNIIPISLKKVNKPPPKVIAVNTNESKHKMNLAKSTPKTNIEFVEAKVNTGTKDWTSSKNCRIDMIKGGHIAMSVEIRQSRPGSAVNGELKIKNTPARHGKINLVHFKQILNKLGSKLDVPPTAEINKQSKEMDSQLVEKTYQLATKLDKSSSVTKGDFQTFIAEKTKTDPDWLASKYSAMLIIDAIVSLNKANRKIAAERLYSQAASEHDLAGPYLKVTQRA